MVVAGLVFGNVIVFVFVFVPTSAHSKGLVEDLGNALHCHVTDYLPNGELIQITRYQSSSLTMRLKATISHLTLQRHLIRSSSTSANTLPTRPSLHLYDRYL